MDDKTIRAACPYCQGDEAIGENPTFAVAFIDSTGRIDVFDHGDEPILTMQVNFCPMCGQALVPKTKNTRAQVLEANGALTLDELREMDGWPVWLVDYGEPSNTGWTLWTSEHTSYWINHLNAAEEYGNTESGWVAYRRPPEGVAT